MNSWGRKGELEDFGFGHGCVKSVKTIIEPVKTGGDISKTAV